MADSNPESWQAIFAALEKYGFPMGIIVGAVALAIAIKRGWLFIGDRTKLAVALAVSEKELQHEREENAELREENAGLKNRLALLSAPQG